MELARHLGKSLTEVLALPSWELTYWQARARVQPIGDTAEESRAARVMAAGLSAWGGKVTAADCMIDWWSERKAEPRRMTLAESAAWMASFGKGRKRAGG